MEPKEESGNARVFSCAALDLKTNKPERSKITLEGPERGLFGSTVLWWYNINFVLEQQIKKTPCKDKRK